MNQEDLYELYFEILMYYANNFSLSFEKTIILFEEKFILEELNRNYELLEEFEIDEILDIIQENLNSEDTIIKLYHGSSDLFDEIDLNKSKNHSDFGRGFYCTVIKSQAVEWAKRQSKIRNSSPILYEYDLLIKKHLKIKRFLTINEEWFDFVVECRKSKNKIHNYDIVIGPIADDDVRKTISLFNRKIYNKKQAIDKLRYKKVSNQISLHSQNAIDYLRFIKRSEIDEI